MRYVVQLKTPWALRNILQSRVAEIQSFGARVIGHKSMHINAFVLRSEQEVALVNALEHIARTSTAVSTELILPNFEHDGIYIPVKKRPPLSQLQVTIGETLSELRSQNCGYQGQLTAAQRKSLETYGHPFCSPKTFNPRIKMASLLEEHYVIPDFRANVRNSSFTIRQIALARAGPKFEYVGEWNLES